MANNVFNSGDVMNVLSLFDGKSSGYTAMELAGIPVTKYYSSEVDKYAIQVSNAIHPSQVRLGDVTKWRDWDIDWASIDIIFGGFPCQAWSVAGKQMGDKDERGMLFWVMLDIMKHVRSHNPKADFLIENVKMKGEFENYITHHMEEAVENVHKTLINSELLSAQTRNRYYWTSFEVNQPKDLKLNWSMIREWGVSDNFYYSESALAWIARHANRTGKSLDVYTNHGKMQMIEASHFKNYSGQRFFGILDHKGLRYITPRECFRCQTVPEHHIDKILSCGVSNSQLYKIAGNGWTDEVIAHILRGVK